MNGKFRIVQLTDLHLGEDPDRDAQTVQMIKNLISKENPDFVAITGDVVSGQDNFLGKMSFWTDSASPLIVLLE